MERVSQIMYKYFVISIFFSVSLVDCCSDGFVQFHDKCYFFSHTTATWAEAGATCQQFQTKLAEPRTTGESQFLSSHSQSMGDKSFWIGISDILEEHQWIYSFDKKPITVSNFAPGEPSSQTQENCVAVYKPFNGKWIDASCHGSLYFICEEDNESINPEIVG